MPSVQLLAVDRQELALCLHVAAQLDDDAIEDADIGARALAGSADGATPEHQVQSSHRVAHLLDLPGCLEFSTLAQSTSVRGYDWCAWRCEPARAPRPHSKGGAQPE